MKRPTILASLEQLCNCFSISGYEWESGFTEVIQSLVGKRGEKVGESLVYRIGKGPFKILISAHMDEVGFFITNKSSRFVNIIPIGDIDPDVMNGKGLVFQINDSSQSSQILKSTSTFSNLKVRGLRNAQIGDIGSFERNFSFNNETILANSLDNKVGCLVLIEIIKKLMVNSSDKQIICCFSDREEVGANGVMQVVRKEQPDLCIDIDSAYCLPMDVSKKKNWQIPVLGNGVSFQLMGLDFILSAKNRKILESTALSNKISYQYEIPDLDSGGTNSSSISNAGFEFMQINIPVANQHSAESMANLSDIQNTILFVEKLIYSYPVTKK